MRTVLYAGVSSDAVHYENKVNELKVYANNKGITEYDVLFINKYAPQPISKKIMWGLVKEYLKAHPECDTIIVSSIGKLVRTQIELEEIKEYMEANCKTLYVMDTDFLVYEKGKITKDAEVCFNMVASKAIIERNTKIERLKRTKENYNI